MHDGRDAVRHDGPVARNTRSESELAMLVDIYGLALLDEPGTLLRLLSQTCPAEPKQTAALLAALGAGIPQRLRGAKDDERLPDLLQESVEQLRERGTFDIAWAGWAVRAWAHALALPTRGLDDEPAAIAPLTADTEPRVAQSASAATPKASASSSPSAASPPSVAASPPAASSTSATRSTAPATPAAPSDSPVAPIPPFVASRSAHVVKAPAAPLPAAAVHAPLSSPRPRAKTFPPMAPARQAPRSRLEPVFVPDPEDVGAATARGGSDGPPSATTASPILVEPLFSDHDLQRLSQHAAPDAADAPADGRDATPSPVRESRDGQATLRVRESRDGQATLGAPAWTRPDADRPRQRGRPVVIVLALIAVAGAALLVYTAMRPGGDGTSTATGLAGTTSTLAQAPASAARPVDPASPASSSSPAPAATAPPPVADATVATAAPAPATAPVSPTPTPAARPSAVPSTEPGTPAGAASNRPAAAAPPASPATAERSTAARPAIARIDVPRVVEGAPFTVAVTLTGDVGNVASVERRVIDSGGSWPTAKVVTPVGALRRTGARELAIPFRAMDAPAYATLLFTVVGRDGERSEPKTATITVAGPTRVGGAATDAPNAPNAALPEPSDCAGSACGTVVEAREIEPEVGTRGAVYQVVVRLDDRRTIAFTAAYRLQTGSRVRIVDGRLLPAG